MRGLPKFGISSSVEIQLYIRLFFGTFRRMKLKKFLPFLPVLLLAGCTTTATFTHMTPSVQRSGLGLWVWFAKRPALYRVAARWAARALRWGAGGRGRFKSLPLAGGWTRHRDLPAPQGRTFQDQWRARRRGAAQ